MSEASNAHVLNQAKVHHQEAVHAIAARNYWICVGRSRGMSLRTIGDAVGLTATGIKKIADRHNDRNRYNGTS